MSQHQKNVALTEIRAFLAAWSVDFCGPDNRDVGAVRPINQCDDAAQLTFCSAVGDKANAMIRATRGGVVVCARQDYPDDIANGDKTLIQADNPRLVFMRIVAAFFVDKPARAIHPSAVIDPAAVIGENVSIGANCYVGRAEIGDGSTLHEGVVVRDRVRIGRRVMVFPGTVIGGDGFGYERNEKGELEKFPHIGGVVIEDDVEIGCNSCIDRGVLGDTRIRSRARVDNLVHVAHNVDIGEDVAVIALSLLGGSVTIGKGAWIAPSAVIRNKVDIGEHAVIGLGAVVTKNVPAGTTVMGNPAKDHKDFKKMMGALSLLAKQKG